MTNDDGHKPEGAPERSPKAGVGAPFRRFGVLSRDRRPDVVRTIEETAAAKQAKKTLATAQAKWLANVTIQLCDKRIPTHHGKDMREIVGE